MKLEYEDKMSELEVLYEKVLANPEVSGISLTKVEMAACMEDLERLHKMFPKFANNRAKELNRLEKKKKEHQDEADNPIITDERRYNLYDAIDHIDDQINEIQSDIPKSITENGVTLTVKMN